MTQRQDIQIPKAVSPDGSPTAGRARVRGAARHVPLDRQTVRAWRERHLAGGVAGLVPRDPARRPRRVSAEQVARVTDARRTLQYEATRTPSWHCRVHRGRLAPSTLQRIVRDLGRPRLCRTKQRAPRQLTLLEQPHPGERSPVDTTGVTRGGGTADQDPAREACPRLRVRRLYRRLPVRSSLRFLGEVCRGFPCPLRGRQCDNDAAFPLPCALARGPGAGGSAIATSACDDPTRTARSNAAIESIRRRAGGDRDSLTSTRPRGPSRTGSAPIIMSASPSHSVGRRRQKSWRP